MSWGGGGGGGGTGPPGPPGQGVPAGGVTGQVLAKASNTDYNTIWQTQGLAIFNTPQALINVLGTEATGARLPTIVIPAAFLPAGPFNWAVESNGYGTFYWTNIGAGVTGTPSGNFYVDIWDGAQWISNSTLTATAFTTSDPTIVRGGPAAGAGASRVFRYDPAVLAEIRYSLRVNSAPTSAYTLNVGLQGYIIP